MPGNKLFVDTNVLIYAYDVSAGKKNERARKIIGDLWELGLGVLSLQVLQEFFVNVTKKVSKPLGIETAREIVRDLLKWDIVLLDGDSIWEAIEIHRRFQFSFWDSMILHAALRGGASILLSEDLEDGRIIDGLKIKNPFTGSDFAIAHP